MSWLCSKHNLILPGNYKECPKCELYELEDKAIRIEMLWEKYNQLEAIVLNKVILIGNLTKETELRYTSSGTAVGKLRLAVNELNDKEPLFIEVEVWGKQAENCDKYLDKGSKVLVEGSLKESKWEHQGTKYSKTFVRAHTVRFLTQRKDQDNG